MALDFNQRSFTKTVDQAAIDEGLRAYMLKVYNYMTTGLVLTGFIAYFFGSPIPWIISCSTTIHP